MRHLVTAINENADRILHSMRDETFPFQHAAGAVPLAEFLGEHQGHEDANARAYFRGTALLARAFGLYFRMMRRLAFLAESAESH